MQSLLILKIGCFRKGSRWAGAGYEYKARFPKSILILIFELLNLMNTILQIILLIIIFSNSIFLMLEKNISSFKILKLSWIIALINILVILFFFELKQSIILYITFTSIIVVFTLGLRSFVNSYNTNTLENHDNRKRFVNFFTYFLLFFLLMLTIGVMKNLLFDSPLE